MQITEEEKELARFSVAEAIRCGAREARASLSKTVSDEYSMLDGELDKVSHTADRSIYMYLYVDGRFGTYSTNRLESGSLSRFIAQCVSATRLLAEDRDFKLPEKDRCATQSGDGTEMGLFDKDYHAITSEQRMELAKRTYPKPELCKGEGWTLASCETCYCDCLMDSFLADSNGVELRELQTMYTISCDVTIEDAAGNKYNSYWWEGSSQLSKLKELEKCARTALERAVSQMNPVKARGGRHKMVVDRNTSSRLFSPILNSLYADAIHQKSSFLCDSLGRQLFPRFLNIVDHTHLKGMAGARLFDSEGVATKDRTLIGNGIVKNYLISTYYASKLKMEPTVNSVSIPSILPCASDKLESAFMESSKAGWNQENIIKAVGNGILVTGFNGGNCNGTTGDFSYGVEGFKIRNGVIAEPVKELLITGNMIELWNHLLAAGDDPRECTRWQIPTLAFENVNFSA